MAQRYGYYTKKSAISAKNGIRARTRRGQFVENWWSRRWIDFIERLADPGRMRRGRTYARQGQVLDIEVLPGLIEARVQGSRRTPYQVRLYFDVIAPPLRQLLMERINQRVSVVAHLLAGRMSPATEAFFEEEGALLFPDSGGHNRLFCTCPDDSHFCKHIAAVLYLVAEVFDQDPLLLLRLRGIEKELILSPTSGGLPDGEAEGADFFFDEEQGAVTGGEERPAEDAQSVPLDYAFYGAPLAPLERAPASPPLRGGALYLLPEFPFWRGEVPFRESMAEFYSTAMQLARQIESQERE